MSRTAYTQCGWVEGEEPSITAPLRGWFWPFPAQSGSSGSGTSNPVEISALDCFLAYWRIRRFQATGSVTLTGGGFTGLPVGIDFIISQPPAMTETYLEVYGPLAPRYSMVGNQAVTDANCTCIVAPQGSIPNYVDARMAISMELDVTAFCHALKPTLFRASAFTATFMGYGIQMWESNGAFDPVVTGSIDIVPLEWWPYDNGTGPIYRFCDGVELITPVPRGL